MSFFVHAGPYTDLEMGTYEDEHALEECKSKAKIASLMTASFFMFTASAVVRKYPWFITVAAEVNHVIKAFCG